MWMEGRLAGEYSTLLRDPVFRGAGVPAGDGHPILLIPGFMAGDDTLQVLQGWLRRLGYRPLVGGISFNVRSSDLVVTALAARSAELSRRSRQLISLIGHSRGGLLAKVLSHRHPELFDQVIALGSPLDDPYDVHPVTLAAAQLFHLVNTFERRRWQLSEQRFLRELAEPARVPVTSIYTRSDGVVNWRACLRPDVRAFEVRGTHGGMVLNAAVYRLLGTLLARAPTRP